MAKVEFRYKNNITTILCSEDKTFEEICKKFSTKVGTNINNLFFSYSGKQINLQNKLSEIINSTDKGRKIMSILVNELDAENSNQASSIIKSIYPICPICTNNMKLKINDYKIECFGCRNGHSKKKNIDEYEKNKTIDVSKIECNICKTNKCNTYNNEMHLCNKCKVTLCPLCKSKHNKEHKIINYNLKHHTRQDHNELYIS